MRAAAALAVLALAAPCSAAPEVGSRLQRWADLREARERADAPGLAPAARADALAAAGEARLLLGDAPGAERDFRAALSLAPGRAAASLGLARALRDRPEEALPRAAAAARAGETPRRRVSAFRLCAELRADLGDEPGAARDLARALELLPGDLETLREAVRLERDRPERARELARRAAAAAARAPHWLRGAALRQAAAIRLELGDGAAAEALARRSLDLAPDHLEGLRLLTRARRAPRGLDEAAPPAAGPGTDDPDGLDALRRDAERARREGRAAVAAALLRRLEAALSDAPLWQRPEARRLLARAWAAQGERAEAVRQARLAEEEEPWILETARLIGELEPGGEDARADGGEAWNALAEAYRELGDDAGRERARREARAFGR